jgi:NitT/TauT family transport system ATP-binding protein
MPRNSADAVVKSAGSAADTVKRSVGRTIEISDVSIRYQGRGRGRRQAAAPPAVQDVNASIKAGEFVGIVGPSGCGKSTLLKAVAGLIPLSGGRVVHGDGPEAKMGFLFQSDALLPWRTASENVELALSLSGNDIGDSRARALELLEGMGLGQSADRYPSQLSGGMRKRVAMARTMAYDPSVFLMDEPFSALDAQTRIQVGNFFLRILEQTGQTVLFVTHDIEEAVALADRVLVMSKGPGRFTASIDIDLPRPRDYHQTRFAPGFSEIQQRVWDALDQSHGGDE